MLRRVLLLAVVARTAAFASAPSPVDDADRLLFDSLDVDVSDSLDAGELVMLGDELSYEAGDLPMGYEAFHAKMGGSARASRSGGMDCMYVDANTKAVGDVLFCAYQAGKAEAINFLKGAVAQHKGAELIGDIKDAVAQVVALGDVLLNDLVFRDPESVERMCNGIDSSSMQGHDVQGPDEGRRLMHDSPQVDVPYDKDKHPSVDWKAKGIITPIKDQGGCSTCIMHATVAVLEAMALKQHVDDMEFVGTALTLDEIKRLAASPAYDFSEAHLASCVLPRGNGGYTPTFKQKCIEYSMFDKSFDYVYQNGGFIMSEAGFPYYEAKDPTCVSAACYTDSAFCPGSSAVAPLSAGGSGQHSGACGWDWIQNPYGPNHRVSEANFERTCPTTYGRRLEPDGMKYVPMGRPFAYMDSRYSVNHEKTWLSTTGNSVVTEQAKMRIQHGPLLFAMYWHDVTYAGKSTDGPKRIFTKDDCPCRTNDASTRRKYASGKVAGNCYNHAVVAVAYDDTTDVWTIKNSAGTSAGDDGYYYFKTGACGAAEWGINGVTSPESAIGGPTYYGYGGPGSAPGAMGPPGTGAACPVPARQYTCDQYRRADCNSIPVCMTELAAVIACGWLASECTGSPP